MAYELGTNLTNRFKGRAAHRPQKSMSERFNSFQSFDAYNGKGKAHPYRIRLQVEEATYSGHNAYIDKMLPVLSVTDWDGFTIGSCAPKGTIVSARSINKYLGYPADTFNEYDYKPKVAFSGEVKAANLRVITNVVINGGLTIGADGSIGTTDNVIAVGDLVTGTNIEAGTKVLSIGTAIGDDVNQTNVISIVLDTPATGEGAQTDYKTNVARVQTGDLDNDIYGYDESLSTILTIANGGVAATLPYLLDYQGKFLETPVGATQTASYANAANKPYGIMLYHMVQDSRGQYLNFDTTEIFSTIKYGRFWIPFVNTKALNALNGSFVVADFKIGGAGIAGQAYLSVLSEYQFLIWDGVADGGSYLTSDLYGKFTVQNPGIVNETKNVQTVARLMTLDSRWPKSLDPMIQQYDGLALKGIETGGLDVDLFIFAGRILAKVTGAQVTKNQIVDAVRAGWFGMAYIDLQV